MSCPLTGTVQGILVVQRYNGTRATVVFPPEYTHSLPRTLLQ